MYILLTIRVERFCLGFSLHLFISIDRYFAKALYFLIFFCFFFAGRGEGGEELSRSHEKSISALELKTNDVCAKIWAALLMRQI